MTYRKKAYPYSDEGSFPILADFHEAEDSYAFERISDARGLKNPSGSCTTPHEEGGKGSGDGTCYQKHREYNAPGVSGGLPRAGENGSEERAEYMRKYRKTKGVRKTKSGDVPSTYRGKPVNPNENGKWDRENGAVDGVSTPRKDTVPRPFGNTHNRGSEKSASEIHRLALELELLEERSKLLRVASEHPHLRGEVMSILKQAFRHPYKKNVKSQTFTTSLGATKSYKKTQNLLNPRTSLNCLKQWKYWSEKDWEDYVKELWKGNDEVHGQCYQIHNDYGDWNGNSTGSSKAYQKWYNENVRQYGAKKTDYKGPKSSGKKRTKENRKELVMNSGADVKKFFSLLMKYAPENIKKDQEAKEQVEAARGVALKRRRVNPSAVVQEVKETPKTETPSTSSSSTSSSSTSSSSPTKRVKKKRTTT